MYPGPYRKDAECTWFISVPVGFRVVLKFTDYDLGSDEFCESNKIQISSTHKLGAIAWFYCGSVRLIILILMYFILKYFKRYKNYKLNAKSTTPF